ncbi:hypothetical protein KIN20_017098 [Parelaphostrongylus tenuis]|uniref:Uncharacterized protein n=1 Tax=Parelaphostrongylus tenuis TaxID=148309 RepID=A0AAD5MHG0_PARTN|nr:hypothetical protein KIN20_017098 [Parelaphostrongylus tenuis]
MRKIKASFSRLQSISAQMKNGQHSQALLYPQSPLHLEKHETPLILSCERPPDLVVFFSAQGFDGIEFDRVKEHGKKNRSRFFHSTEEDSIRTTAKTMNHKWDERLTENDSNHQL